MRVESDLAKNIKREVTKEKEVAGAFDLILNNYGPDNYLGSVHIEVSDTLSVSDVFPLNTIRNYKAYRYSNYYKDYDKSNYFMPTTE